MAAIVTSVSASSSINETALCRLPESEDLATLLEGAAGVSPLIVLTTTSRGFPVKVTRMDAADNEPIMWVDDLLKTVRQKDVEALCNLPGIGLEATGQLSLTTGSSSSEICTCPSTALRDGLLGFALTVSVLINIGFATHGRVSAWWTGRRGQQQQQQQLPLYIPQQQQQQQPPVRPIAAAAPTQQTGTVPKRWGKADLSGQAEAAQALPPTSSATADNNRFRFKGRDPVTDPEKSSSHLISLEELPNLPPSDLESDSDPEVTFRDYPKK